MIKKLNNKKSELNKGILHLSDLKIVKNIQSEQFYFELRKNYKIALFKTALSISKNIRNLAKKTNINYFNLWDCIKRAPISLSNLRKLSDFLTDKGFKDFSLENIEKNIRYIKGGFTNEKVYKPKFPINLITKNGMRFLAHLYHDGGIGKENRQPNYTNKSFKECREFLKDAKIIFGNFFRSVKLRKDGTYSVELPTVIGDILISFGYTPGDKTKQNPPTFPFLNKIKNKELVSGFLAKAFNDDGSIGKRQIILEQSSLIKNGIRKPSNVLLLDKYFLEELGIKVFGPKLTNIYPNRYGKCTKYVINVYSKQQFKIFNNHIKLINHKRKKLEENIL